MLWTCTRDWWGRGRALRAALALVGGLLLSACRTGPLTQGEWFEARTDHFIVVSNGTEQVARTLARDLERFRAVALAATRLEPFDEHLPVKVFLLSDYASYFEFTGGRRILGYMWPTLRANYIVVGPGLYYVDQHEIVYHEYVHYLLRNQPDLTFPAWYDEGLAETLSTLRVVGNRAELGALARGDINALASAQLLPLETLARREDILGLPARDMMAFYAQSWALAHFVELGHRAGFMDRRKQLDTYLQRLAEPDTGSDPFQESFGFDATQLDRDLRRYLKQRRLPAFTVDLATLEWNSAVSTRQLSPEDAAKELGRVMLLYGDDLVASAHDMFHFAATLAPADAEAMSGMAVALGRTEDIDDGIELARRAVDTSPDDAQVRLDLAGLLLRSCAIGVAIEQACTDHLEEAHHHYGVALKLDPALAEGHAGAGMTLSRLDRDLPQAIDHLDRARAMSPWMPLIGLELGRLHLRTGNPERAAERLRDVVRWSRDPTLVDVATGILDRMQALRMFDSPETDG